MCSCSHVRRGQSLHDRSIAVVPCAFAVVPFAVHVQVVLIEVPLNIRGKLLCPFMSEIQGLILVTSCSSRENVTALTIMNVQFCGSKIVENCFIPN